jgi:hypothetical protein
MAEQNSSQEHAPAVLKGDPPSPRREFALGLRERLMELDSRAKRPEHLWLLVGVYLSAGIVLLVLAALSAAGGGPLG